MFLKLRIDNSTIKIIIFKSVLIRHEVNVIFETAGAVEKMGSILYSNNNNQVKFYFENATTCSKRMRKTTVATQLKTHFQLVPK